jgi:predicted site-specific integrase-resolvase
MEKVLNQKETMMFLHVSKSTLHRWDKDGTLVPFRTIGGHRRYLLSTLEEFIGKREEEKTGEVVAITYARCSTNEQKQHGDIERQSQRIIEYCVKKKYKIEDIIKDCGSGLNDRRRGFVKLCDAVPTGNIDVVVVENKDRLSRFGFNML